MAVAARKCRIVRNEPLALTRQRELEQALLIYGTPDIFNSDQGCQFTADMFTSLLKMHGVAISMDDVIHEDVYLKGYASVPKLLLGLTDSNERWSKNRG